MAKLHLIALEEGETLSTWFNGTGMTSTKQFDVSEWADLAYAQAQDASSSIQDYENAWTTNKNKIRFESRDTNGLIYWAQWNGKYEIVGDKVTNGFATSFERDWEDGPVGRIKITGFKYPVTGYKTAGAFHTLTLPEAITDHFDSPAYYDHYGNAVPVSKTDKIRSLKPGMTYTFETIYDTSRQKSGSDKPESIGNEPISKIDAPSTFKIKDIDRITNFNPSTDTLEMNTDSFGIDSSATFTFASGKNKTAVKKKLAKQDFDFLYDEKKGGLNFNENGTDKGFGDGGIVAILNGAPDLTSGNLEFI